MRAPHVILNSVALAAALSLVSCSGAAPAGAGDAELTATVDSLVAAFQRETYAPGVSVAIVRGGRDTLVLRGYGLADVENDVPATPATVYPIASITKQFTTAAVMHLVEENRLALDDSVGRHLPELPAEWRRVRIRHLLNHTSGVPNHPVLMREEMTPDSVVALAAKSPFEFAPGTQPSYSNVGYLVLGLIIEKVTEQPYGQYLETRIFRPNGLAATRYCHEEPLIEHRASGYVRRDTGVVNAPQHSMLPVFAAGGLCSTVGELAAWNHALATGRVVSPASWDRMTTPEGAAVNYGYGTISMTWEGHRMVGHSGALAGFVSASTYLPDDSLSVTLLTNLGGESIQELVLEIVRAALQGSRPRNAEADSADR
ncbi:MAG TPA: serine hydrolase domain-containing protein [Longimicrobium sp.]|nr:serine hydrolase domain-containing protein [Longimicrobium sp.]